MRRSRATNNEPTNTEKWWRGAVFYQIAPRSFYDTTGNGIGDLPGATARLDYVASLNVDGIWITPFYPSPMEDFGYDVSDYRDVDPLFGTLDDFDAFMAKAHDLGLKVIIDLPLSHTSDRHRWFTEKPDYYVWADGKPEEPVTPVRRKTDWKSILQKSRILRAQMTDAEQKLWHHLRRKNLGARFRRQYQIPPYIVDFVSIEKKLIIEVDGGQHSSQQEADEKRTKYLESLGYRAIRFWNNDVFENIDGVLQEIKTALSIPPPDAHDASSLPPPEGGGSGRGANKKARNKPPNNWVSVFGGSAWEWHEQRGQYYLHNFLKSQPDLNFHNPNVQREMLDICKFWLERGVDGLRLDVCNFYFHDPQLRNNPPRKQAGFATQLEAPDPYNEQAHIFDKSQPENFKYLQQIRAMADEYNAFVLGELGDDEPYKLAAQYTDNAAACHSTYNPQLMGGKHKGLTAPLIRTPFEELANAGGPSNIGGWPSWAFSNHDVVRAASRWCNEGDGFGHDPRLSKMLIALLGCLRGTAFIYQGEELGLPEVKLTREQLQDPWGKHLWPVWQGRDGCRTPMPWSADTPADQWLPVPDEHKTMSVSAQDNDPDSTLNFARSFLKWRSDQPALITGDIEFHETRSEKMLHFTRRLDAQNLECRFDLQAPYDFSVSSADWEVSSSSFSSSKPTSP